VSGFRLPLALSLTAHALLLALLLVLPAPAPPLQPPAPAGGIEVAFAPSLPAPEKPPTPQLPVKAEPPPPPPVVTPPPPPPPIEPSPPAPEATVVIPEAPPPPPPRKPAIPTAFKPVLRRPERERPSPAFAAPTPSAASLPRTAFAPRPAPAPSTTIGPEYRSLLSEWLERHKRYPDSAREHSEEGRAVLRFAVERSGRVTEFAVVQSTGYPDLDAALDEMMRGATLPAFPADMPQSSIVVSVTIHFSLEQ
jgi:protein TonB